MGQRALARLKSRDGSTSAAQVAARAVSRSVLDTERAVSRSVLDTERAVSLSVFDTELGWFGLAGRDDVLMRVFLGHASADEVRSAARVGRRAVPSATVDESDWNPKLRRAIQDFARGIPTDFNQVKINLTHLTPFRKRVMELARKIAYGRTTTYGELAARAGSPGAARAIGAVMASNTLPIIVPCHRVVASGGSLGGFSAPQGIDLKRRLLEMEAAAR